MSPAHLTLLAILGGALVKGSLTSLIRPWREAINGPYLHIERGYPYPCTISTVEGHFDRDMSASHGVLSISVRNSIMSTQISISIAHAHFFWQPFLFDWIFLHTHFYFDFYICTYFLGNPFLYKPRLPLLDGLFANDISLFNWIFSPYDRAISTNIPD